MASGHLFILSSVREFVKVVDNRPCDGSRIMGVIHLAYFIYYKYNCIYIKDLIIWWPSGQRC